MDHHDHDHGTPVGGVVDRRLGLDRRHQDTGSSTNLERRRGKGRRRSDFVRAAEEGEMTGEQFLFLTAIEAFKKANDRTFPTWTDVLEVVRKLGYRKTMASEIDLRNRAEDWTENPDAPTKLNWGDPGCGDAPESPGQAA